MPIPPDAYVTLPCISCLPHYSVLLGYTNSLFRCDYIPLPLGRMPENSGCSVAKLQPLPAGPLPSRLQTCVFAVGRAVWLATVPLWFSHTYSLITPPPRATRLPQLPPSHPPPPPRHYKFVTLDLPRARLASLDTVMNDPH